MYLIRRKVFFMGIDILREVLTMNPSQNVGGYSSRRSQQTTPQNLCHGRPDKSVSHNKIRFDQFRKFEATGKGNCIFDLGILTVAIKCFVRCKSCNGDDCT